MNEPALWGLRRKLLDARARLGLVRPVVRLYELLLAARSRTSAKRLGERSGQLCADLDVLAFRSAAEDGRHDMHLFRKPAVSGVFAEQPS